MCNGFFRIIFQKYHENLFKSDFVYESTHTFFSLPFSFNNPEFYLYDQLLDHRINLYPLIVLFWFESTSSPTNILHPLGVPMSPISLTFDSAHELVQPESDIFTFLGGLHPRKVLSIIPYQ